MSGVRETIQLRGGQLADDLRAEIIAGKTRLLKQSGMSPRLATLSVGENPASRSYRGAINRALHSVEIDHVLVDMPSHSDADALGQTLARLSDDPTITGVLVLMPLPPHLPTQIVNEALAPIKDVDGITPANAGRLHLGLPCLAPSTPQGGIALLDHYEVPIAGQLACVVGRSNVVGRPLGALLLHRDATVVVCHSRTPDIKSITRQADIVSVATGNPEWLTRDYIKEGAAVLDFGINVVKGKVVGDADFESLKGVAGAVTPVPGGTGPITALILARNTVAAGFAQCGGSLDSLDSAFPELVNR